VDPTKDFSQPAPRLPKLKFNKRIQVILICFFVSVVFWFLIAMSKTYTDKFIFPVQYINFPDQRIVVNDLPKTITLMVKTSGFRILAYRFTSTKEPVVIDVASSLKGNIDPKNDMIAVPSKSLSDDFVSQLGSDYSITGFAPDSILFTFSNKASKRVPVILQSQITMSKQHDTTGTILLDPDSVTLTGPGAVISGINFVKTELLQLTDLKSSVRQKVGLEKTHLVTTSVDHITVLIPVEKFTEGSMEIPVHAINVQSGFTLKTFPDKVKVLYRVSLSKYNEVRPEMFDAVVDASGLPDEHTRQLKVKLETIPYFIRTVTIEPEKTDYILRK
jgi:YbbR domain-containing protein